MTKPLTPEQVAIIDKNHIWHPYSSLIKPIPAYQVVSASGVRLKLSDGTELIDGMSSWWSAIHGYNHPVLNKALIDQIDKVSHVMFGGITHEPAATLCKTLVDITPDGLDKVFLSDSGSVSVEVALKMALQFWSSQGRFEKSRFLSFKKGYHGDTLGAMSVCDPVNGMHSLFNHTLDKQIFAEAPICGFHDAWEDRYIYDVKSKLEANSQNIAAVIIEPVMQGAGGLNFYSPFYMQEIRKLCDSYDVLLIADEIATGFGRTGKLFACEWSDTSPDILCIGKALTGGYMTLAATLCTSKISNTICSGGSGVFMHGPTYMGNPLACSVANASINLLLNIDWQTTIKRINTQLKDQLSGLDGHRSVKDVRCLGAVGVVEMFEKIDVGKIQKEFVSEGIWIRPFDKRIYLMPPYNISSEDLKKLTDGIIKVVNRLY
mgnify:FL=1